MKLYNHILKTHEIIDQSVINWYCCGPTVHADTHMGHARTFIIFDSIRKYLTKRGKLVNFGINITDIDDKINDKIRRIHFINLLDKYNINYNVTDEVLVLEEMLEKYFDESKIDKITLVPTKDLYYKFIDEKTNKFWDIMKKINVDKPTNVMRVSNVIKNITDFIDNLIEKEYAYVSNGSIYFDTEKYKLFFSPCLLHDETIDNVSVKDSHNFEKKNVADFALWKSKKKNSISFTYDGKYYKGEGTPGWHIECSVMSTLMFKNNVDIHSGGIDLKFPHHHNEILQSNSYHDQENTFKHCIYTGHIYINDKKMSQSLNNYVTVEKYLEKHTANSLRLLMWKSPWEKNMELLEESILFADNMDKKIHSFIKRCEFYLEKYESNIVTLDEKIMLSITHINEIFNSIEQCLYYNFKTVDVLKNIEMIMNETNKFIDFNKIDYTFLKQILFKLNDIFDIIGLTYINATAANSDSASEFKMMNKIVEIRDMARANKFFVLSDKIRDSIIPELGYVLQDTLKGSKIHKKM